MLISQTKQTKVRTHLLNLISKETDCLEVPVESSEAPDEKESKLMSYQRTIDD